MALFFKKPKTRRLSMQSFRNSEKYVLDLDMATCSCKSFEKKQHCKHLAAMAVYPKKPFEAKTHPTFSQANCALVKAIRIRQPQEAVYWLCYIETLTDPQYRFRAARRILIGSSEDGMSIPVMEKVAENFPKLLKKETGLLYLVAEVVRICKVPNWWKDEGGTDYVKSSLIGHRRFQHLKVKTEDALKQVIVDAIDCQDRQIATAGVGEFWSVSKAANATAIAEFLLHEATVREHKLAERLLRVHLNLKTALSQDANFLGQAAWHMAGGQSAVAEEIHTVTAGECHEMLKQAAEDWKNPHPVPTWACDGVHCAGNVTRYMGMLPEMMAVCNAYKHYGAVGPELEWLPSFVCTDGLNIEWLE